MAGRSSVAEGLQRADAALRGMGQKQIIGIILEFLKIMGLSCCWFLISVTLVFFNRWLFHVWNGGWCVASRAQLRARAHVCGAPQPCIATARPR